MKNRIKYLFLVIITMVYLPSKASHIVGGQLTYECVNAATGQYLVTQKLYRDCSPSVTTQFNDNIWVYTMTLSNVLVNAASGDDNFIMPMIGFPQQVPPNINDPCIAVPDVCVEEAIYQATVFLSVPAGGLKLVFQRCCRNDFILNINNPGSTGSSYTVTLPPPADAICNSSAIFNDFPPIIICADLPLSFDHSASDSDGDVLVYSICAPLTGGSDVTPIISPATSPPFPMSPVTWVAPYNVSNVLGGVMPLSINSSTGEITAIPGTIGQFVVGVCVAEYRGGELISEGRRDFQFNVTNCQPQLVAAVPSLVYNCSNNTVTFTNNSFGSIPITDYLWTFGDLTTTSDTSTVFEPTYVYPDTGTYNVQLIVNPGISCADTGRCLVNIYPYLTPDFSVIESCVNFPYVFNNESTTTYGVISDCQWDFGDGSTGSGLSATHIYTSVGDYTATLIVTNTFGCVDSITQIVNVDVTSSVQLTPDTVFCQFDGIELQAGGGVIYNWLPPTFLSNPSIANPLCTATTVTTYTVEITNAFGCFNTATVTVTPITTVSVVMDSALTDCVGDTVQLKGNVSSILQGSLSYDWSPNTLDSNNPSNCIVPSNTTTYTLTASLGTCFGTDTQTINAIPLPIISISPNQRICENDSTVLVATGGSSYLWSPPATIDRPTFGATMVYPDTTTIYNCNVSVLGVCARTVSLSTQVEVIPYNVKLGSDQVIYLGENIAFSTDSSYSYYWYPPELFSVPTIPNPTYKPTQSGFVVFTGVSLEGCVAIDSMYVKVIDPSIEAPNAFSPNGDGINDVFMLYSKDYKYNSFNIYDRWGEKVFSTNDTKQGWDGTWKGKNASSGVYVYYATYYNELETEQVIKGNVTLIR